MNQLRKYWIISVSLLKTAGIATRAVIRSLTGTLNRSWVNQTMQTWSDELLRMARVNYVVINPYHVQPKAGRATLIMCNHSSLYDIPLSFRAFPDQTIRMLSKKELADIPILGKAMRDTEFPIINRHNRHQAILDLQKVKEIMERGVVVWIAPEGTRSDTGKLGHLKKGGFITAIETKAEIIPIGIRGANKIAPARTFNLNLNQQVEIHIGKPIDASVYSLENKEKLIEEVRSSLKELIGETAV